MGLCAVATGVSVLYCLMVGMAQQPSGEGIGAMMLVVFSVPMVVVARTASDTTQHATPRNDEQPPARKSTQVSRFCNFGPPLETGFGGLWL